MKNQLEFYNTPSGYVMYDEGQKTSLLSESSRDVVDDILDTIRECYSDAYRALQMRTVHLINVILRLLRIQGSRTIKWYTGS